MQIYQRRYGVVDIDPATDRAMFGFPLPAKSTLNYMKGEFHYVGPTLGVAVNEIFMVGTECWILQTDTFADFQAISSLWNTSVPKDDGIVELDDDFSADVDNFFEPGLVNPAQIFDQELLGPERIYQNQKMLTIANSQFGWLPGTPNKFIPTYFQPITISKSYKVNEDSGCIWGFASPDYGSMTTDDALLPTALATDGFYIMRFMEDFLDKAMVDLVGGGLTEAGAESPFEDIMDFILALLEDHGVNNSVLDYTAMTWSIAGKMIAGTKVEGSRTHTTMGPDAQA